jgi:hypothetical protein
VNSPWEWDAPERNAWLKAIRLEDETEPEWDRQEKVWFVPSNTEQGKWYAVYVLPEAPERGAWWLRLGCSCPAGDAGRRACWHRARVALLWTREATVA